MARYYEETVLIEFIKQYTPTIGGETTMKCVERSIREAPTADVAPRAEVAREIFEEIEKIIEKHHSECYEYEDGDECDTAITYISYLSVDIDDLKKKYTQ